jgi:hypothetical protein
VAYVRYLSQDFLEREETHVENDFSTLPKTLICRKCEKEKPITEFVMNKSCKYGFEKICKQCHRVVQTVADKKRRSTQTYDPPIEAPAEIEIQAAIERDCEWDKNPLVTKPAIDDPGPCQSMAVHPVHPITQALYVDFTDHPNLYKSLCTAAKQQFRSPEMQILHLINHYTDGQVEM